MAKRNGVFVGSYVPSHIREFVARRAKANHTTMSEVIKSILAKELAASLNRATELELKNSAELEKRKEKYG